MSMEQNDIPPHERGKAETKDIKKYWFVKGTENHEPIKYESEDEADSVTKELNKKGGRCFVVGPFGKDEKGQYFHCGSDITPKRRRR